MNRAAIAGGAIGLLIVCAATLGARHPDVPNARNVRSLLRERANYILGDAVMDRVPPEPRVEREEDVGDHVRRLVSYFVAPGDRAEAWLLVPKSGGPVGCRPAVICAHQTVDCGKDEPVGLSGPASQHTALELVRRGFVCFAPDAFCAGRRCSAGASPFDTTALYRRFPDWSAPGKQLWDLQRGLDVLAEMPEVDAERIGVIGVSLGGHDALWLGAMDERIRATVVISGPRYLRTDPMRRIWCRPDPRDYLAFPRLRPYVNAPSSLPFDFDDLALLILPRHLLELRDSVGPNDPECEARAALARESQALITDGGDSGLTIIAHQQGHGFPPALHEAVYHWLETRLGLTGEERIGPGAT